MKSFINFFVSFLVYLYVPRLFLSLMVLFGPTVSGEEKWEKIFPILLLSHFTRINLIFILLWIPRKADAA